MRVTLKVTAGPHKGQKFKFEEHDNFIVGRSKRAHFQLPQKDKYFSRIHFMIEVNPPFCRLMDMGSRNGTKVNDQKVTTADLNNGDKIEAGKTILRVFVEETDTERAALVETLQPAKAPTLRAEAKDTMGDPAQAQPAVGSCVVCGLPASGVRPLLCAACLDQSQSQPQPLSGFQIIRELGRGGMGVVYLAVRQANQPLVALKTIIPAVAGSKALVDRFVREASILRELDHPNIVAFREIGEENALLYFAMDYVQGTDARQLLKRNGPLPIDRAVGLICQLLEGLEYAHGKGFVHRDIKPGNMLVTMASRGASAPGETVKLADFGLARTYQASQLSGLTMMGQTGGTVHFMAPEQITDYRDAKPAADQYAAAATLYNLLTDKYIYDSEKNAQMQLLKILQEEPVPLQQRRPDVPKVLAEAIHGALAREPKERFADVNEMRQGLLPFAKK